MTLKEEMHFPLRISLCVKDPQKAAALREKISTKEGFVFLKPLWQQPEIAWAADVIVLAGEDAGSFQNIDPLSFCPAILLETADETAMENLGPALCRAPFGILPGTLSPQQVCDLVFRAAMNTRFLLSQWHTQGRSSRATQAGHVLRVDPMLSLDTFLAFLSHGQGSEGFCQLLGGMFTRWSGASRALILHGHDSMRIAYCFPPIDADTKDWTWSHSEPWVGELRMRSGVVKKSSAGPQLFRWMEALKVQYMMSLRHQGKWLGALAFTDREESSFSQEDLTVLGSVAAKMAQALDLPQQPKMVPTAPKADIPPSPALATSKEVLRKQQLDIIGRMAMRSSHELKNCLVSIRTFTQLFPEKYADEQFRKDFYAVVSKEVERLNGLVEKLLFFAQPVQLKFSQEKITDLISEALSLFAPEDLRNIELQKVFGHQHPLLWLDPQQMLAVFFHVLQNSLHALSNGGKLVIVTEDHPHHDFADGVLVIRFLDTGRGVAVKDHDEPFEPFFSTKARGMGLGLTIARKIVEEHGGTIRLDSSKDHGTEVIICLPRKIPSWEPPHAGDAQATVANGSEANHEFHS